VTEGEPPDEQPTRPPLGWYPDPERPGTKHRRFWDGERWTDQYTTASSGRGSLVITVLGGILLIGGCALRTLANYNEDDTAVSELVGYGLGTGVVVLGVVFLLRLAWVRFFAKGRSVWSPWALVAAGVLALIAAGGRISENQQTIEEAADLSRTAQAECEVQGVEAFPASVNGFEFDDPSPRVEAEVSALMPPSFDGVFEVRLMRGEAREFAFVVAAPIGESTDYEDFVEGATSDLGVLESVELRGGDEFLQSQPLEGYKAGIVRGECHAYLVSGAPQADLVPYAEALIGAGR